MTTQEEKQSWKQTLSDPPILWVLISFLALFASYIWQYADPENMNAPLMSYCSWLSSLLAVGYVSTPSQSWPGKIAFTGVIIMVAGIGFKILHLPFANVLIIIGLITLAGVYIFVWRTEKKNDGEN